MSPTVSLWLFPLSWNPVRSDAISQVHPISSSQILNPPLSPSPTLQPASPYPEEHTPFVQLALALPCISRLASLRHLLFTLSRGHLFQPQRERRVLRTCDKQILGRPGHC